MVVNFTNNTVVETSLEDSDGSELDANTDETEQ